MLILNACGKACSRVPGEQFRLHNTGPVKLVVFASVCPLAKAPEFADELAGDVIFLPRKQLHSLECTDPESMVVAGVIYPGDNPSINY